MPRKSADRSRKPVDVPCKSADRSHKPVDVPRKSADRSHKPVDVPRKSADRSRKPVDVPHKPVDGSLNQRIGQVNRRIDPGSRGSNLEHKKKSPLIPKGSLFGNLHYPCVLSFVGSQSGCFTTSVVSLSFVK